MATRILACFAGTCFSTPRWMIVVFDMDKLLYSIVHCIDIAINMTTFAALDCVLAWCPYRDLVGLRAA
jgi:hypothetical protein